MTLQAALERTVRDLEELGAAHALIGGLAVSVRTEPRFTRDVDLAVAAAGDREAERVVNALLRRGYRMLAQLEQDATGRLATVRLAPPGDAASGIVVDLLFASSGIEPAVVAAATPLEVFPGTIVPVATCAHLIAMKTLARDDERRPQDRADLVQLIRSARPAELEEARRELARIEKLGFHRNRDLVRALDDLIRG